MYIKEMEEQVIALIPENEKQALRLPNEYPFILHAGRHMQYNANTLMRNPEWNNGKRACTIAMHPDDAHSLHFIDGQDDSECYIGKKERSPTGKSSIIFGNGRHNLAQI